MDGVLNMKRLSNSDWLELINTHHDALEIAGEVAFTKACTNTGTDACVVLSNDGTISTCVFKEPNEYTGKILTGEALIIACFKVSQFMIYHGAKITDEWTKEKQLEWYINENKNLQALCELVDTKERLKATM